MPTACRALKAALERGGLAAERQGDYPLWWSRSCLLRSRGNLWSLLLNVKGFVFCSVRFQLWRPQAAVVPMMNKKRGEISGTVKLYFSYIYIYIYIYIHRGNLQIYTQPNETTYTYRCAHTDTRSHPKAPARPALIPKYHSPIREGPSPRV